MEVNFFKRDYEKILNEIDSYKILIVILITTLLVYSPILFDSQFLTYDDNWYIYENDNVINFSWSKIMKLFTASHAGQYSPLGELYNFFVYYLFGKNPTAFKVCGLFVHLLNCVLLFKVFEKIFNDKLLITTIVVIFAIHPLQVETINWLSVMFRNAAFFMFLGYYFYLKYLEHDLQIYRLIPVVVCYISACMFKEQGILFPVGLFIISIYKSNHKWDKRFIIEMFFWGILALAYGLLTLQIIGKAVTSLSSTNISLIEKISVLCNTIIDYCYNFMLPLSLSFSYPYPLVLPSNYYIIIALVIILISLGAFFAIKNKLFRFGFLWLMGFLSLSLASSFSHLRDTYMADRYVYVAIIGYSILLYLILNKLREKFKSYNLLVGSLLCCVIFFSFLSFNRVSVFRDSVSLWTNALKVNPQNQYANNSLGFYYRISNDYDKAEYFYKKALEVDSSFFLAHSNIGKVYFEQEKYDSALFHLNKAIAILPNYERAYLNRAAVYNKTKDKKLLLKDLNKILEFRPNDKKYRIERAKILFVLKNYDVAISDAKIVLSIEPNNHYANYLIGHSSLMLKKYKIANIQMDKAILNNSNNAKYYYIRSLCRFRTGDLKQALKDAAKAQKLGYKVDKIYIKGLVQNIQKIQKVTKK